MKQPHKHAELIKAWADEYITYDERTGTFVWKKHPTGRAKLGSEAGRIVRGYRRIGVLGKEMQAHVLAWIIVNATYPDGQIDHIDGDKTNNSINNLRLVTHQENQHNQRKAHKRSSSGYLGAHKDSRGGFSAKITVNNKTIFLGRFSTAIEAHKTYILAKQKYHPSAPQMNGETGKLKKAEVLE